MGHVETKDDEWPRSEFEAGDASNPLGFYAWIPCISKLPLKSASLRYFWVFS